MAYEKVVVMIPEVKRATLGGKPIYRGDTCAFKTKAGKKMTIPKENVLIQDEKSIVYKLMRRRLIKGDFELKDGFLLDSDLGCRVSPLILSVGEEKPPRTAAQKQQDKKRAAAMAKARKAKGTGSGATKTAKPSRTPVKKKKIRVRKK